MESTGYTKSHTQEAPSPSPKKEIFKKSQNSTFITGHDAIDTIQEHKELVV